MHGHRSPDPNIAPERGRKSIYRSIRVVPHRRLVCRRGKRSGRATLSPVRQDDPPPERGADGHCYFTGISQAAATDAIKTTIQAIACQNLRLTTQKR
jgi:hypothetical protein